MCGRFDQSQTARFYASVFGWADAVYDSEATPAYNVSPGTYRPLMHIQDGQARVDDVFWSYRARWADGKVPICINARLDKLDNRYWRGLLKSGRAIVAADGWYEWTGEKGRKQPWHIHRKDGTPLYMLALANFGPFTENRAEAGFVLVTDDAAAGMLDIHDRKPVVLNAEDAQLWLDPGLTPEQAMELARRTALPSEAFEWHKVSSVMNKAGTEGPQIAMPLPD
ncbi:SOS response-associated peptidase [Massilia terrae]|uniref:Abasic site processing protein n=1 Tax=Massilia terrae TaxID=1811224 RepID=A0ABT2CWS6_9BURK|nr:SOS response-associated peptidase family protein [Massilia terrae]MCS0657650.1 SOS response-associated peptidase family protein [Massilia terrae]